MECNIYNRQDYGGYWRRSFANLFDGVFLAIAFALINAASEDRTSVFILGLLTFLAYMIVFKVYRGATPGYHILGIKIVSINGTDVTLKQVIVRLLSSFLSGLALGLGFLWIAIDRNKQAWHDKAAGTYVIKSSAGPIGTVEIPQARLIRVRLAAPLTVAGLIFFAFVGFCIGVLFIEGLRQGFFQTTTEGRLIQGYFQTTGSLIGKLNHRDPEVRRDAASRLGDRRDPRAVEPLFRALQDENSGVRHAVMISLGELKDPRAIEPLIKAFAIGNRSNTFMFADALAKIGEPAVEPVIAALKHQDKKVRLGAACALRVIKDPRAVGPLIAALKDANSGIQRCAWCALGTIKDPRAVEPLIEALKDRNSIVRYSALEALKKITEQRFDDNPEKWRKWWEENKETFIRPKSPSK